jgi:hypothetical protein
VRPPNLKSWIRPWECQLFQAENSHQRSLLILYQAKLFSYVPLMEPNVVTRAVLIGFKWLTPLAKVTLYTNKVTCIYTCKVMRIYMRIYPKIHLKYWRVCYTIMSGRSCHWRDNIHVYICVYCCYIPVYCCYIPVYCCYICVNIIHVNILNEFKECSCDSTIENFPFNFRSYAPLMEPNVVTRAVLIGFEWLTRSIAARD